MLVEFSFFVLGIFSFLSAWYGITRYRTPLNPLTIFSVTQIGLFTIYSGIVATGMLPTYSSTDIVKTLFISSVYLGGATLPYLFHGALLSRLFGKAIILLRLNSGATVFRFSQIKFILILFASFCSFIALMFFGGGGALWLTDSREAYMGFRSGAGPFYALTQWLMTFAMLYYIWCIKAQTLKLCLTVLLFVSAISFLGSKNNMLTIVVIGMIYYNFRIKSISYKGYIAFALLTPIVFLNMLLVQGSYSSMLEGMLYFRDYFDTTAQMLSRFDEFGFRYGQGWVSSLWFYVPRGLFPDKPYEYGVTLIHQVLYPGAAQEGGTPGLLVWSLSYLDFGLLGVFIDGLFVGIFQKSAFDYFLKNRENFFAFLFAIHFSIWPIWTFAPLVLVVIISLSQSIFIRLMWRVNRHYT